jgi:hypothetical protein
VKPEYLWEGEEEEDRTEDRPNAPTYRNVRHYSNKQSVTEKKKSVKPTCGIERIATQKAS